MKTKDLTKIAIVAAVYIILSLFTAPFCFGPIQLRLAEMLNLLVAINKRYIWAVTLGCAITNFFSPLGLIDVIVGAGSTLLVLLLGYTFSKKQKSLLSRLFIIAAFVILGTGAVAAELYFIAAAPFWVTYATIAAGEAISLTIGIVVLCLIKKTGHLKLFA